VATRWSRSGCGGTLVQSLAQKGIEVKVLYLTRVRRVVWRYQPNWGANIRTKERKQLVLLRKCRAFLSRTSWCNTVVNNEWITKMTESWKRKTRFSIQRSGPRFSIDHQAASMLTQCKQGWEQRKIPIYFLRSLWPRQQTMTFPSQQDYVDISNEQENQTKKLYSCSCLSQDPVGLCLRDMRAIGMFRGWEAGVSRCQKHLSNSMAKTLLLNP